jgi:hypothetical protein
MAYSINKTDGSLLVTIVDSGVDRSATDLVLIGKNVTGYGEYINENFVKVLENFASTSEPNNPLVGQIWFDTSENRLKVYDGINFRIGSGPIVQGTSPLNPIQGDFWIDSLEGQLYFYTGTQRFPAGKIWKDSQKKSGFTIETVTDTVGNLRTVVALWCAEKILGVFSNHAEFLLGSQLGDITGLIKPGFTQGLVDGFKFNARATSADTILGPMGTLLSYDDFIPKTGSSTITPDPGTGLGTLTIQHPTPLKLGANQQTRFNVDNSLFQILSTRDSQDFKVTTLYSATERDAITVKSVTSRVGIFNSNPQATLDVGGSLIISGNLTVNGTTTSISTVNLEIEDKLIDLGKVDTPTDITADGGGIRLLGATNHTMLWSNANDSWDSSEHFNIAFGKEFRINNQKILDRTSLATSVVTSSLTSVGTLTNLNTSGASFGINILDNTITTTGIIGNVDLIINTKGTNSNINVSNSRITNLTTANGEPNDAATAYYVNARTGNDWITISADYDAGVQDRIAVDTTSGSVTVSLPPSPSEYQFVKFADKAGMFNTNPLKVVRYRYASPGSYVGTAAAAGIFAGLSTTTSSVTGSGLIVDVTITGSTFPVPYDDNPSNVIITIIDQGYGYQNGETITILGSDLGGTSPANDLTFTMLLDPILGMDSDYTVDDSNTSFGLTYLGGSGWKFSEQAVFPPALVLDTTGTLTGNVISSNTGLPVLNTIGPVATFLGNVTGNLTGRVTATSGSTLTGNVTGNVIGNVTGNITGVVTGTAGSSLIGNVTGNVTGNIQNNTLTVTGNNTLSIATVTGAITMTSGANGILIRAYDGTGTLAQNVIQITPATNTSGLSRSTTALFGDVVVNNTISGSIKGASFKLPTYTNIQRNDRTPGALNTLNYGELIYNNDSFSIQAYVKDGITTGYDGWVNLNNPPPGVVRCERLAGGNPEEAGYWTITTVKGSVTGEWVTDGAAAYPALGLAAMPYIIFTFTRFSNLPSTARKLDVSGVGAVMSTVDLTTETITNLDLPNILTDFDYTVHKWAVETTTVSDQDMYYEFRL